MVFVQSMGLFISSFSLAGRMAFAIALTFIRREGGVRQIADMRNDIMSIAKIAFTKWRSLANLLIPHYGILKVLQARKSSFPHRHVLTVSISPLYISLFLLRLPMLKATYPNGSTPAVPAVLRHRQTRNVVLWLCVFLVGGSLWWYMAHTPSLPVGSPPQSSVYIHKTEGEIDVLAWPEERWFVGPRNETQLEKAALIMLVRYIFLSRMSRRRG